MGQKIHPNGFRVGITRDWESKWYAERQYSQFVKEDLDVRSYVADKLKMASVAKVVIERAAGKVKVFIHSAKPGIILGKRAAGLDVLREDLNKFCQDEVFVNVIEVRRAETDSTLVAANIAAQLEKRVSFRRAMKKSIQQAQRFGAEGVKIMCSGRLGGAEMSRTEWYREGRVPLHTLRADVDYGTAEAATTYGIIGIKVWIFKGDSHDDTRQNANTRN
jgi:small subunit ribosomal protein S3